MLRNADPVLNKDDREIIIFLLEIVRELHARTNGAISLSDIKRHLIRRYGLAFLG